MDSKYTSFSWQAKQMEQRKREKKEKQEQQQQQLTMDPYLASKNIETYSMLDFTSFLCEAYRQLIFIFVSIHLKKDFFWCVQRSSLQRLRL